jgi:hypothetical protein
LSFHKNSNRDADATRVESLQARPARWAVTARAVLYCRRGTREPCMPKIDIAAVPARQGSGCPPPFDAPCAARTRQRLCEAGGLRDFGVNLMTLPPGSWSSQRHWHIDAVKR